MNSPAGSPSKTPRSQRGGFGLGFLVGLLVGIGLALAVALYVTKAPVPFVDKVPALPNLDEKAEAQRNKDWDPNAGLASKAPRPAAPPVEGESGGGGDTPGTTAPQPTSTPAAATPAAPAAPSPTLTEPAPKAETAPAKDGGKAISGKVTSAADPYVYYVQAGAFQRPDEAEAQRAKLALLGVEARVIDREQGGKMMHRVRMGPFDKSKDAEALRDKLNSAGLEAALVRVERSAP